MFGIQLLNGGFGSITHDGLPWVMFKAPMPGIDGTHTEWCFHGVENRLVRTGQAFKCLWSEHWPLSPFHRRLPPPASPQECVLLPGGTLLVVDCCPSKQGDSCNTTWVGLEEQEGLGGPLGTQKGLDTHPGISTSSHCSRRIPDVELTVGNALGRQS